MIKRVRDTFFQCLIRISIEFPAAIVILRFDDTLHHEHTLQVFQGAVYNLRNRTFDDCSFVKVTRIIQPSFWEIDNLHLCPLEKFAWILTKHHGRHVSQHTVFLRADKQVHLLQNLLQWSDVNLACQFASDFHQIFTQKQSGYVFQTNVRVAPFIKWHTTGKFAKFIQHLTFGDNAACSTADIEVFLGTVLCRYILRNRIRTVNPGRAPYYEYSLAVHFLRACPRHIVRGYLVIIADHILKDVINLFNGYSFNRPNGNSGLVVSVNAYHDITTTKVVKIICESAYAVVYTHRIPTFLKFNPIGFYPLFIQQVVYVDSKCHNYLSA